MINRTFLRVALSLALATGVAGCIEDPTQLSEDGIPLTEEEAAFLGLEAWRASIVARQEADVEPEGVGGPAATLIQLSEEVSLMLPCDFGGSVATTLSVDGSYDDVAETGQITLVLVQDHQSCGVERNGTRYTIDGWPDLRVTIVVAREGTGPATLLATLEGGILASRGDATGICSMDLSIEGTEQPDGSGEYSVYGSVCGAAIEASTTSPAST